MEHLISNSTLSIKLDGRIYPEDIVFKSMYWLLNDYTISISRSTDYYISIVIEPKDHLNIDFDPLIKKIKELLIDFKTRSIIQNETKAIRELLIAKAFSATDEFDSAPPGNLNDTVGINMKDFK